MSVYTRPDSKFYWLALERPRRRPLRTSTRIPVDGGTREQTSINKRLAQEAYAARMADLARQHYELPTTRVSITFKEYLDWYEEHYSAQKRNLTRERSMLRQLGRYFDDRALDDFTREDAIEWRTARRGEVSPGTVNRELALLKHPSGAVPVEKPFRKASDT